MDKIPIGSISIPDCNSTKCGKVVQLWNGLFNLFSYSNIVFKTPQWSSKHGLTLYYVSLIPTVTDKLHISNCNVTTEDVCTWISVLQMNYRRTKVSDVNTHMWTSALAAVSTHVHILTDVSGYYLSGVTG